MLDTRASALGFNERFLTMKLNDNQAFSHLSKEFNKHVLFDKPEVANLLGQLSDTGSFKYYCPNIHTDYLFPLMSLC